MPLVDLFLIIPTPNRLNRNPKAMCDPSVELHTVAQPPSQTAVLDALWGPSQSGRGSATLNQKKADSATPYQMFDNPNRAEPNSNLLRLAATSVIAAGIPTPTLAPTPTSKLNLTPILTSTRIQTRTQALAQSLIVIHSRY